MVLWFTGDSNVSVWPTIHRLSLCLSMQSKFEGVGKKITGTFAKIASVLPPGLAYVNKSTMCPEVTPSSMSLNPCRRWGFKVVGQLSGSADRVLIRSHSATVQSLGCRKEKGHVPFKIYLPLVYYSVPFLWLSYEACKNSDAGSVEMLLSSEHAFQSCKTTHKRLVVPVWVRRLHWSVQSAVVILLAWEKRKSVKAMIGSPRGLAAYHTIIWPIWFETTDQTSEQQTSMGIRAEHNSC